MCNEDLDEIAPKYIHEIINIFSLLTSQSCKNTLSEFVKNSNDFFSSKGRGPVNAFDYLSPSLRACLASSDTTRTPPSPTSTVKTEQSFKNLRGKRCYVKNGIQYQFGMRYHELKMGSTRMEDVMFASRKERGEGEKEGRETQQRKRVGKFRRLLERNLAVKE